MRISGFVSVKVRKTETNWKISFLGFIKQTEKKPKKIEFQFDAKKFLYVSRRTTYTWSHLRVNEPKKTGARSASKTHYYLLFVKSVKHGIIGEQKVDFPS
jgi:hypothetical protein